MGEFTGRPLLDAVKPSEPQGAYYSYHKREIAYSSVYKIRLFILSKMLHGLGLRRGIYYVHILYK